MEVLAQRTRLFLARNFLTQPSEALKSGMIGFTKEEAFNRIIMVDTGM